VIRRTPRPVYELDDINKILIDAQFYEKGFTPVRSTKQTQFQIDKIVATRVKEHPVWWRGFSSDFDRWIPA